MTDGNKATHQIRVDHQLMGVYPTSLTPEQVTRQMKDKIAIFIQHRACTLSARPSALTPERIGLRPSSISFLDWALYDVLT